MRSIEPKLGDVLGGRFRLDAEIGRGGHGVVFRAEDLATGGPCAVKVLLQNIADDPQFAVRLSREAEAMAALWGSSVVEVRGFHHDAAGTVYMVMELLEGETLEAHLIELEGFGDRMSAFEVLTTLDPIAGALHLAHLKGIIHRDVKPANVFLLSSEGGGVRLMDFGLARIQGTEQLTQVGMITGSPSYVAPEIWRAQPFDHRVDVYALAALAYRCFAGAPPFTATTIGELYRRATTDPRPHLSAVRPDLGSDIDTWVELALALDCDQRYPYVSSMWNDSIAIVMRGNTPSAERVRQTFRLAP